MTTVRHLTTEEYAEELGVTPEKLTEWVAEGEISPAISDQGIAWWRHEDGDPRPTRSHQVVGAAFALLAALPPGLADHPGLSWTAHAELVGHPHVHFRMHRATPEDRIRCALAFATATGGAMEMVAGRHWHVEAPAWRDGVTIAYSASMEDQR